MGDSGYGLGVVTGDFDGDGHDDIYVNNYGPNVLYRNRGDRTFENVTDTAGVSNGNKVGAGVSFLDIDADGDLDLYVGNYVDFTLENHVAIAYKGTQFTASPQYYDPVPDTLYRNDGAGSFTDISQESGIADLATPSMGLVAADLDNDGDTDVYVCNDGTANTLFLNDGTGHFREDALLSGVAYSFSGKANSSMGVDCADYDGDGLLDLVATNYQAEMPNLYHNLGGGLFEDAALRAQVSQALLPHVNWGVCFGDVDNDGNIDLFIVCGHLDRIESIDDRTALKTRNFLLLNQGDGTFRDASTEGGPGLAVVEASRGAASADFDNDGDLDFLVVNSNARPTLLRNDLNTQNHWLKIQLRQSGRNSRAVGAKVVVKAHEKNQNAAVISGRGYQSHYGDALHFGLGPFQDEVLVQVFWPDGEVTQASYEVDQSVTIHR